VLNKILKIHKIFITPLVVICSLHVPKIIELRQGIQMLQANTSVGTTLVGQPCMPYSLFSVTLILLKNLRLRFAITDLAGKQLITQSVYREN